MLFNSYAFIFVFAPITYLVFFILGRLQNRNLVLTWIALASLVFYGIWNPINLAIIMPSVVCNYLFARLLQWMAARNKPYQGWVLAFGVAANIAFLGYFKYRNFFFDSMNTMFAMDFPLAQLVLPLGISFITFQKIAFLADVQSGKIKSFELRDFLVFVLFFPQLIAGPIVHYTEMMPQFERIRLRPNATDIGVAITLFSIGLFKKVILADGIAPYATAGFTLAAHGEHLSLFQAWGSVLAYTFQIYFDFSGYTDMALGLARVIGIKLPLNFNSPFKSTSIVEFWGRWHVSLTRFLTAYVYTPVIVALTRRRMTARKPVLQGRKTRWQAILWLVALPTILTMAVSGIWHGAGAQFIVWGLCHGVLLTINQAWRMVRPRFWKDQASYDRVMRPVGFALTFLSVVAAMAFFRASSVHVALDVLDSMVGGHGVRLPEAIWSRLSATVPFITQLGIGPEWSSGSDFVLNFAWVAALFCASVFLPNSLQLLARYEPALGYSGVDGAVAASPAPSPALAQATEVPRPWWAFAPTRRWAALTAIYFVAGILALNRVSEFLYWQF